MTGGGWWDLYNIAREAQQLREQYDAMPPQACPNDGEPLQTGPNGKLYCKFDGWKYPDDARAHNN